MDRSFRKTDINHNIIKLLNGREKNVENAKILEQRSQFTESWISRLGLEYELQGHHGCVNCLEWSSNGRHLASGSDDTNIIIWDPFTHRLLTKVQTTHIGNIFSVKFLGSDSSLIASGAGDCRIIVQSVEQKITPQTPHLDCNCHLGRIKRLATSRDEPLLFWSAGEDGVVIQYDLRESHDCAKTNQVLIDLGCGLELKCIAINPVKSHLLALGANECSVRLFDRRMIKPVIYNAQLARETRNKKNITESLDPRCVQYYVPGHLSKDFFSETSYKLSVTYISFDSTGSDMLVNMGGEQIYLFDLDNPRYANELQIPDNFRNRRKSTVHKSCCNKSRVMEISSNSDFSYNQQIASELEPCACPFIERGQLIFQRKWSGDVYSAARDYLYVIKHWPDNKDAYLGLIQCLIGLRWTDEAYNWLEYFKQQFPEVADTLEYKELHTDLIDYKNKLKDDENSNVKESKDDVNKNKKNPRDYEYRFLGHCNTITDIKEANFLGKDGDFICAGSDDGVLFIWNRKTTNIEKALVADSSIVNCVQPHPTACFIATSGIDPVVKLWSPTPEEGVSNKHIVANPWPAVEANQQRMNMDPFETMLANLGYRISPVQGQDVATCRTS